MSWSLLIKMINNSVSSSQYSGKLTISESGIDVKSFYALLAVATMLLPAHPSIQSFFYHSKIPSSLLAFVLFVPVLFVFLFKRVMTAKEVYVIAPFLLYIAWLLFRSVGSSALGLPNFMESLRSLIVLIPLSLVCGLVAARNFKYAAKVIVVLSLVALVHFLARYFIGNNSMEADGFRSLSTMDRHNYQSTGFYLGMIAMLMVSFIVSGVRRYVVFGVLGLGLMLFVMGLVGARSSTVAVVATAVCFLCAFGVKRLIYFSAALGVILIFIFVADGVGLYDVSSLQSKLTVLNRLQILFENDDPSHRIRLFSEAVRMWLDSSGNFFIGGGVGAYPSFIGETEPGWYPHNFILESLAEGGVLAGFILAWIGVLLIMAVASLKKRLASIEEVYVGALAVYALFSYQFMGGIQSLWIPAFFVSFFLFVKSRYVNA